MTEQLIIRLLANGLTEWALLSRQVIIATSHAAIPVTELARVIPQAQAGRMVTVLVPGTDVLVTDVTIPTKQQRHMNTILPYLLEEKLAEEITLLHFAHGKIHHGKITAAAIRKSLMDKWLGWLREGGIIPQVLLPETLAMPFSADAWHILYDGSHIWLRTGRHHTYALERDMFPPLFEQFMKDRRDGISIRCYVTGLKLETEIHALQSSFPHMEWQVESVDSAFRLFCRDLETRPELNLLQGEYAPSHTKASWGSVVKILGRITAVWFLAQMALDGGQALYFSHQSEKLNAESIALYKELFPADTKILDPLQQMKGHLARPDTTSEGFLGTLQQLGSIWNAGDGAALQIESLAYNEDGKTLTLNLNARSPDDISRLAQLLSGQGMNVKTLSLQNDRNGVKGQLAIQGEAR